MLENGQKIGNDVMYLHLEIEAGRMNTSLIMQGMYTGFCLDAAWIGLRLVSLCLLWPFVAEALFISPLLFYLMLSWSVMPP